MIEQIKQSLPNFPDEIISSWLGPLAQQAGWPPTLDLDNVPEGRWKALMMGKSLQYWQSMQWAKVSRHLSPQELDPDSQGRVVDIALTAVAGQTNWFSILIPDLKHRFDSVVAYISEHGVLPVPPVLIKGPLGLGIADGNHRVAAYIYCYGYLRLPLDDALLFKAGELQSYWLGTPAGC